MNNMTGRDDGSIRRRMRQLSGLTGLAGLAASLAFAVAITSPAAAATFKEGERAYLQQDFATSFRILSELARRGHARSQYLLGRQYQFGQGVKRSYVRAYYWYSRAEKNGHVEAGLFRHLLVSKSHMTKDEVAQAKRMVAGNGAVASAKVTPPAADANPQGDAAPPTPGPNPGANPSANIADGRGDDDGGDDGSGTPGDTADTPPDHDAAPANTPDGVPNGTPGAARAATKKVHPAAPGTEPKSIASRPVVRGHRPLVRRVPRVARARVFRPKRIVRKHPVRRQPRQVARRVTPHAGSGWVRRARPAVPCRWCGNSHAAPPAQRRYLRPQVRTHVRLYVGPGHHRGLVVKRWHRGYQHPTVPQYVWRLPHWRRQMWMRQHMWRMQHDPFYRRAWRAYRRFRGHRGYRRYRRW